MLRRSLDSLRKNRDAGNKLNSLVNHVMQLINGYVHLSALNFEHLRVIIRRTSYLLFFVHIIFHTRYSLDLLPMLDLSNRS